MSVERLRRNSGFKLPGLIFKISDGFLVASVVLLKFHNFVAAHCQSRFKLLTLLRECPLDLLGDDLLNLVYLALVFGNLGAVLVPLRPDSKVVLCHFF